MAIRLANCCSASICHRLDGVRPVRRVSRCERPRLPTARLLRREPKCPLSAMWESPVCRSIGLGSGLGLEFPDQVVQRRRMDDGGCVRVNQLTGDSDILAVLL